MNFSEARREFLAGHPWSLRLEYRGSNNNNVSGKSSKWWEARGDGGPNAYINWGKIGSSGRSAPMLKCASDILYDVVPDKIREGYVEIISKPPLKTKPIPSEFAALPEPYCLIRMIILDENYRAYDEGGNFLLQFEKAGAMDLIKKGKFTRFTDSWKF